MAIQVRFPYYLHLSAWTIWLPTLLPHISKLHSSPPRYKFFQLLSYDKSNRLCFSCSLKAIFCHFQSPSQANNMKKYHYFIDINVHHLGPFLYASYPMLYLIRSPNLWTFSFEVGIFDTDWFSLKDTRLCSWRRKWQPTPVFLLGESQGWGSLVGCRLWGRTESDTIEVT